MLDQLRSLLRVADLTHVSEVRLAEMLTIYVALAPARPSPPMPRPFIRTRARLKVST